MEKINPNKKYIPLANTEGCACNECPYMRLNTIDKMIHALETLSPEIILDEDLFPVSPDGFSDFSILVKVDVNFISNFFAIRNYSDHS